MNYGVLLFSEQQIELFTRSPSRRPPVGRLDTLISPLSANNNNREGGRDEERDFVGKGD